MLPHARPAAQDATASERGLHSPTAIGATLSDLAPGASHRKMFWLICIALFVDFFDLTMGGAIAGSLLREGWTTISLNSLFFSAAGIGAAVGVFGAGILADRMGRIRVLQICLVLMTIGTLACAAAPTMPVLIAARVLAAVGMGGLPTIGYVYLSEVLPSSVRGSWISAAGIVVAASSTVASVAALYLLPMGGWRIMFLLPAVAGLLLIAALHFIPESPRWLAASGQMRKAARELGRITAVPAASHAPTAAAATGLSVADDGRGSPAPPRALFRPPLLRRLALATGLAVAATVISNTAVAWMPTLLLARGTVERGLSDNFIIMLGAPLGSVVGYFIMSRVSRRGAIAVTSLAAACLAAGCAYVGRESGLIPLAFVLMASINLICTIILGVYLPELFPTPLRARGSSFALTVSRLVLIVAPFATAALLIAYGRMGVMLGLTTCLLATTLLVVWIGVETSPGALDD
jgi:putative MFS transporter